MKLMRLKSFTIESSHSSIVNINDLEVQKGSILGVVGKSGSGKTMTFKGATGLISDKNIKISGHVYWEGQEIDIKGMKRLLGKEISYVMQNPMTAFNQVHTIGYHCYETLRCNLKISKAEAHNLIKDYFLQFGLTDTSRVLKSYPYQLSGGMLQRVMLSIAMALGSKLIIADEPTTALDNISQREVVNSFLKANKEYGVTIVFISHDFPLISEIANYIAVIMDGELVEMGTCKDILTNPQENKTINMLKGLIDNDMYF